MGEAGQPRPGIIKRLTPVVVVAIIAFGITSMIIVPTVRDGLLDAITDLRMRFLPELAPILAIDADGDGESEHPASAAADDNTLSYWLVDPGTDEASVTVEFDRPFNLGALVFHLGSSTEAEYNDFRRPKVFELTFPGTESEPLTVTVTDVSKDQGIAVDPRDVESTIVVTVKEWFESTGGDKRLALREIEFQERQ